MILMWSGSIATIPSGFHLCDGTTGTPDLRDRFIAGAGTTYVPGANGGALAHTHPFTGDGHNHLESEGISCAGTGPAFAWKADSESSTDVASGDTDSTNHLPPYYALAYIMKL